MAYGKDIIDLLDTIKGLGYNVWYREAPTNNTKEEFVIVQEMYSQDKLADNTIVFKRRAYEIMQVRTRIPLPTAPALQDQLAREGYITQESQAWTAEGVYYDRLTVVLTNGF